MFPANVHLLRTVLRSADMDTSIKETKSKLDPFEDALLEMDAGKITLAEMQQWLSGQGVAMSLQGISHYLSNRRQRRWQAQMLERLAKGVAEDAELKGAFNTHPEPDLETMLKLARFVIMQQTMQLAAAPEITPQTYKTTKMVLGYINSQLKQRSGWE